MDVFEAITSRKSIRKFMSEPVPRNLIREILEAAIRSPSAKNAQPWEFFVLDGEALESLKKGNVEAFNSGVVSESEVSQVKFKGVYRERQVALATRLFRLMKIKREDREKRTEWQQRGVRFFDAPLAIFLIIDKSNDSAMTFLDLGAVMQTICLAATARGLGTCIEDQGAMFPDVVRKHLGLSASKRIVICIAIGYADPAFPANKLKTTRESLDNLTTWVDTQQDAGVAPGGGNTPDGKGRSIFGRRQRESPEATI